MKTSLKIGGGVAVACAACCAVTIVPALVAGTSLTIGGAAIAWEIGLVAAVATLTMAGYHFLLRLRARRSDATFQNLVAGAPGDECGCGSDCASSAKDDTPIACTLDTGDFKERTASIRDLARRSLRNASRTPLSLTLTYGPEAAEEVRTLIAKERICCAFLAFDLKSGADRVLLTITAPKAAAEAADNLFDHFAPELAAFNAKESA